MIALKRTAAAAVVAEYRPWGGTKTTIHVDTWAATSDPDDRLLPITDCVPCTSDEEAAAYLADRYPVAAAWRPWARRVWYTGGAAMAFEVPLVDQAWLCAHWDQLEALLARFGAIMVDAPFSNDDVVWMDSPYFQIQLAGRTVPPRGSYHYDAALVYRDPQRAAHRRRTRAQRDARYEARQEQYRQESEQSHAHQRAREQVKAAVEALVRRYTAALPKYARSLLGDIHIQCCYRRPLAVLRDVLRLAKMLRCKQPACKDEWLALCQAIQALEQQPHSLWLRLGSRAEWRWLRQRLGKLLGPVRAQRQARAPAPPSAAAPAAVRGDDAVSPNATPPS